MLLVKTRVSRQVLVNSSMIFFAGTWTGEDYHCKCDCRPGTSGDRCEKDSCQTLKCLNGGHCKVLDSREICNCTEAFTGLQCEAAIKDNPCSYIKCQNGGICTAVKSPKNHEYHRKCMCPKHWAGLECQRPNMCLNRCLNGGRCVSTIDGTVSCICPPHLTGPRCEYKRPSPFQPPPENDDEAQVNSTVITVISTVFGLCGLGGLILAIVYFYRKTRLGSAFKHRRMAENLLSNNIEFSNQMFMPEADEDAEDTNGGSIIRMRDTNNFSNPVYEEMYENARPNQGENEGLLPESEATADLIETMDENDENAEAVDLLTERHRGNISL